jgi:hypothetical protein
MAVAVASGNPIGLIVGGAAKIGGEVTGKSTIEGSAKRTAKEIADQLRGHARDRGGSRCMTRQTIASSSVRRASVLRMSHEA